MVVVVCNVSSKDFGISISRSFDARLLTITLVIRISSPLDEDWDLALLLSFLIVWLRADGG